MHRLVSETVAPLVQVCLLTILIAVCCFLFVSEIEDRGTVVYCTADAHLCPDGSWVGRSPPDCAFYCPDDDCPCKKCPCRPPSEDIVYCTADVRRCPDGTYVGRSGPDCEFICPDDFRRDLEVATERGTRKLQWYGNLARKVKVIVQRVWETIRDALDEVKNIIKKIWTWCEEYIRDNVRLEVGPDGRWRIIIFEFRRELASGERELRDNVRPSAVVEEDVWVNHTSSNCVEGGLTTRVGANGLASNQCRRFWRFTQFSLVVTLQESVTWSLCMPLHLEVELVWIFMFEPKSAMVSIFILTS
jgi:hypothetical protein